MGERKVINKYIPADFDPSLVPRGKKLSSKDGTVPVRMMLPFSMQCGTCHTFLYRGRKYNSKKEAVQGSQGRYLGIQRWRFYIKCHHCSRPITFLTDPQNADYEMESGATRNFELHRAAQQQQNQHANENEQQQEQQVSDPMKALEDRVVNSQREMADLDNLEEIKAMNARHVRLDPLVALAQRQQQQQQNYCNDETNTDNNNNNNLLTEQDEALIRSIQFGKRSSTLTQQQQQQQNTPIQRLSEEDEVAVEQFRKQQVQALHETASNKNNNSKTQPLGRLPVTIKFKKRTVNGTTTTTAATSQQDHQQPTAKRTKTETPNTTGGLGTLLGGYGSDSDSD